jgi:hypothetical protein
MAKRTIIHDDKIHHTWMSPDTSPLDEEVTVSPDFYEESGTPTTSDGEDMVYAYTEIDSFDLEIIAALRRDVHPVEMFYTPEDRKDADAWIENQSKGNPSASVAFMVGYNYAMQQVANVLASHREVVEETISMEEDNATV